MLLHEVQAGAEEPIALVWPRDSRAARVAARVQADPAGAGSLQELCRGQAASARTVQRIFPLETGLTFEAWRARLRFLHASRLLAEGHKVSEVAALCGYRSASGFVVAFRRMGGCTPGRLCATGRADPSAQG
jgi:AraC-like DNA-binding protein